MHSNASCHHTRAPIVNEQNYEYGDVGILHRLLVRVCSICVINMHTFLRFQLARFGLTVQHSTVMRRALDDAEVGCKSRNRVVMCHRLVLRFHSLDARQLEHALIAVSSHHLSAFVDCFLLVAYFVSICTTPAQAELLNPKPEPFNNSLRLQEETVLALQT